MGLSRDVAFLRHMLDEVRFLRSRSAGLELEDITEDQVLQRAFVQSLEVLSEAAKNVSVAFKDALIILTMIGQLSISRTGKWGDAQPVVCSSFSKRELDDALSHYSPTG